MSDAGPMNHGSFRGDPDNDSEASPTVAARARASTIGFVLLAASVVFAGLGVSESVAQPFSDLAKVIAVGLFVGAMVALAMGMIGDPYHRN